MANYFYYDQANLQQGPIDEKQVKDLVAQGIITSKTQMATDTGRTGTASQITNLFNTSMNQMATDTGHTGTASQITSKPNGNTPGIFDIHFTRFISNTWISIIWVILIIAHFIGGLMFVSIAGARDDGALLLIIALVAVLFSLLLCRMCLELNVIFFRIESNTRESKECLREIKELLAKK